MRREPNVDIKRFKYFDQFWLSCYFCFSLKLYINHILANIDLQKEMDVKRGDGSELQINDRVASEGHYGSVKFIGTLPDTKGK